MIATEQQGLRNRIADDRRGGKKNFYCRDTKCGRARLQGPGDGHIRQFEHQTPHAPTSQYRHNCTGEDNADAHMKRQIMGREVVVAITKGKLDFGPWQQIFHGEFDGNRRKRVLVKIIGE